MALTTKQTRFVAEYLIDGNATQAAIRAGYSEHTAHDIGCENLKKPNIAAAINANEAKHLAKLDITAENLIRDVLEIGDEARQAESFAAALKSRELLGRSLKDNPFAETITNKVEDITPRTPLDRARRIAFLLARAQREGKQVQAIPATPQATKH